MESTVTAIRVERFPKRPKSTPRTIQRREAVAAQILARARVGEAAIAVEHMIKERSEFAQMLMNACVDAAEARKKGRVRDAREAEKHAMNLEAVLNGIRDRILRVVGWPTPPKWGKAGPLTRDSGATSPSPVTLEVATLDSPTSPGTAEPS